MMQITSILALLALAKAVFAIPAPAPANTEGVANFATKAGGANAVITAAPHANIVPNIVVPPQYLTFTIINSHGDAISTSHVHGYGAPTAVSGNVGPGTMANGETATFAVPTGWTGNVMINDASWAITGDDSLIEGSFLVDPSGYTGGVAGVTVDVSYANGFSVAIVCSCAGQIVTGCNKNLYQLNACPNPDGQNACPNPTRADTTIVPPPPFFAPCAGAAFTFPLDGAAQSTWNPLCQLGQITCCVGAACPANPRQSK